MAGIPYKQDYHQVLLYQPTVRTVDKSRYDVVLRQVDADDEDPILYPRTGTPIVYTAYTVILRQTTDPLPVTSGIYPSQLDVDSGSSRYGPTGSEYQGTLVVPPVVDVRLGETYGGDGSEFTGTLALPIEADVKLGVDYGGWEGEFTGTYAPTGSGGGSKSKYAKPVRKESFK